MECLLDWELCDIHFCAFTRQGDDAKKGNVLPPADVGPDSRHFEPVRQVQGDEGDMSEALQEHDDGKDCKLYLNGLRHVYLPYYGYRP